jgi:hypothetical protein
MDQAKIGKVDLYLLKSYLCYTYTSHPDKQPHPPILVRPPVFSVDEGARYYLSDFEDTAEDSAEFHIVSYTSKTPSGSGRVPLHFTYSQGTITVRKDTIDDNSDRDLVSNIAHNLSTSRFKDMIQNLDDLSG